MRIIRKRVSQIMTNPKLRKTLVTLHLVFAGLLTPAFLLLAVTGGNYLLGNKGSVETTMLELKSGASLNFDSETLDAEVRELLDASNIDHKFEYIKNRGSSLELRPTSKPFIRIQQSGGELIATMNKPSLQAGFMELHKGHGPKLFKTYQKIVALGLIGVVLGGFLVGILAPAYRRRTLIATGLGTVLFFALVTLA